MDISRRTLLVGAAAALVVELRLAKPAAARQSSDLHALNPFISISADGRVRLVAPAFDMGQGSHTSLAMILCDELGARWEDVSVEGPGTHSAFLVPGINEQATHGSLMVRNWHDPLRKAAAGARERLVLAAAAKWQVPAADCFVSDCVVSAGGKSAGFGELVADAIALDEVETPRVLGTKKLVGHPIARLDIPSKTNGSAKFGIDVRLPNMAYAAIRHAPVFGSVVETVDDKKLPQGVLAVVKMPNAVIAVAESFWKAKSAVEALEFTSSATANDKVTTADLISTRSSNMKNGKVSTPIKGGDPHAVLSAARTDKARQVLSADYDTPYLAHMSMEPMNCTAWVQGDHCEVWVPTQGLSATLQAAVSTTGFPEENILIHPTMPGGGFGRKYETDFVVQAIRAAMAVDRPVQLIWTREEDVQHDFYRPAMSARLTAALTPDGAVEAFVMRKSGPSILEHTVGFPLIEGSDPIAWLGFRSQTVSAPGLLQQYSVANVAGEFVFTPTFVPIGYWRSVGASENGFFIESFVDELAHAAGADPYEFRRRLLKDSARGLAVLEKVAREAKWGVALPEGHFQGIAITDVVGSIVAQVVEISMKDGAPMVHRVTVAIDCGRAINPDSVVAQMQGGIVMGLSAALKEKIDIQDGRAEQNNFYDYEVAGLAGTPQIDVHIIESGEALGGVGEAAVPAVAPALANAVFAATGKRVRSLPLLANL